MRDDFSEPVALGSQPSSMTYHRSVDTILLLNTIVRHHGYEHCTMDFHTPKAAIVTRSSRYLTRCTTHKRRLAARP